MAKINNKWIKFILCAVTFVMIILSATTFFMPTIKAREIDNGKFSAMEICFLSTDKCQDKIKEASEDLDWDTASHYAQLLALKNTDEAKHPLNATAWCHFVALLSSIATLVLLILCWCKKNLGLYAMLVGLLTALLMIATIISLGCFMGVEVLAKPLKEAYSAHAGAILGLITSVIAAVAMLIKVKDIKVL